jgi:hypothetical protein
MPRRSTRENKRHLNELREAAFERLRTQGLSEDENDYVLVNDAGNYGTEEYVLRNLVNHLPNHSAKDIVEACLEAKFVKLPEDELLVDDHIVVRQRLAHAYTKGLRHLYQSGPKTSAPDEYRKIMRYSMTHIEDGHLIVSMLYDRGIGTLNGMLKFLPEMKSGSHRALTEGIL